MAPVSYSVFPVGKLGIYPNPNQVLFELVGEETSFFYVSLFSRVVDSEYPNYQEIIPKKYTAKIQTGKEDLKNQIKEAGLFSSKVSEVKLQVMPKEKKLKVFSQSAETGKNEAYLAREIDGSPLEIAFNHRFLVDGLNNIKSSEVSFEFSGEEGPGVLRPVGDSSFVYILMPIKS